MVKMKRNLTPLLPSLPPSSGNTTVVDSLYPMNWRVPMMKMNEFSQIMAKVGREGGREGGREDDPLFGV